MCTLSLTVKMMMIVSSRSVSMSRCLCVGADVTDIDVFGKTAFDYITDHEEWIESGYFTEDTRARLKGWPLDSLLLLAPSFPPSFLPPSLLPLSYSL